MSRVLEVKGLESGYGKIQVLWGVNLALPKGGVVAVLGSNGAGKTTLLKTIMGLIRPWKGSISLYGKDVTRLPAHVKVNLGINMVPEGRRLFPDLTVRENLEMGAYTKRAAEKKDDSLELVFNLFPRLKERINQRAGSLSGGEQQMLAVARALMTRPSVLLLDEPSQGLAPKVAWELADTVDKLRGETGMTILLVEQNVAIAVEKAEYLYVLEQGRIILEGPKEEVVTKKSDVIKAYLGL
ncbi:MAG: ABC transporter ATP-binding protein [Thermoprotei archaeon]|nr:ABC transporter ATP-binding protein [Thermoprotei archaeon]